MKICPNCKAQLEEDAIFCGECGQKVPEAVAEETAQTSQRISGTLAGESSTKICSNCGAEIPANKKFCADCGTPIQGEISHEGVLPQAGQPLTMPQSSKEAKELNPATVQKIALAGAVMTFVSVFLPLISGGLDVFSLLGANLKGKFLGLVLAALSFIAYQSTKNHKYEIVAAVGQTILWPIIAAYIYCSVEMPPFLWAMIRCDIGGYCLILGALLLVMSGLLLDGTPLNANALLQKWKEYIIKPIRVSNFALPSFGWIIGIPVVVGFILNMI